jgi:polar amino acid transport system substrate-binding protein
MDAAVHRLVPTKFRAAGVIKTASSIGFAPYEFYAANNRTYEGLDIDLLAALQSVMGIQLQATDVPFPSIVPSLKDGRYDMAMSAFTETPEDEQQLNLVSYFRAQPGLVVSADDSQIKTDQPLSLCGDTVAIVAGESSTESLVRQTTARCQATGKAAVKMATFQSTAAAFLAIESGQIAARAADTALGNYTAAHSAGKLKYVPTVFANQPALTLGIAVPKSDPQLLPALQAGLRQIKAEGQYAKILARWKASDGALTRFTIVR